jgi:hypothetical protein
VVSLMSEEGARGLAMVRVAMVATRMVVNFMLVVGGGGAWFRVGSCGLFVVVEFVVEGLSVLELLSVMRES